MSKQKRPPQHALPERALTRETTSEVELSEQSSIGNQAVQAQIDGLDTEGPAADMEAVRAEAMPVVERAMIALYTEPRPAERIDRFVSVLETSRLPADRKAVLIEKLVSEQEAAVAVAAAAERWFGSADLEARTSALGSLDAVWAALEKGSPGESTWRTEAGEVALTEPAGSLGERAEQLMTDLARASAGTEMGDALRGFCREVYLIVAWHQEEEEEEESGDASAPEIE
ncbi:MAG: hypothetical protein R3F61_03150 [Myxococcota bacterium]